MLESCTKRAYLSFIGMEILCQPTQASSSSSGLVLLAMMRLRSLRDRHFSLPSTCLQYLPLPYMPSSLLASSVTTAVSFSLACADMVSVSSVMKFSCTQLARLARTVRSAIWASAFFMNASASATVAGPLAVCGMGDCDVAFLAEVCANAALDASITRMTRAQILFENMAPPEERNC